MGSGRWDVGTYSSTTGERISTGTTYGYSGSTMGRPREDWKAHATLDPKGVKVREARDSAEHPESVPIAVIFDVTGSMAHVPRELQANLPDLLQQITDNGYVEHPQVMFGAVGDATCDKVPLQVGQFESDNRMDEDLNNLVLEAGGGSGFEESYDLALYFLARHTATDAWDKRSKKGYAFLIGDEMARPYLLQKEVNAVLDGGLQEDIPFDKILAEAQEHWDVYFILPAGSTHFEDPALKEFWTAKLGQNCVCVDNTEEISKVIAKMIGVAEGTA